MKYVHCLRFIIIFRYDDVKIWAIGVGMQLIFMNRSRRQEILFLTLPHETGIVSMETIASRVDLRGTWVVVNCMSTAPRVLCIIEIVNFRAPPLQLQRYTRQSICIAQKPRGFELRWSVCRDDLATCFRSEKWIGNYTGPFGGMILAPL